MLHLFNLFSKWTQRIDGHLPHRSGQLPHTVVLEAIENVVDGTEPGIRLVRGYKKKLHNAVSTSLAYIDELVETLPVPVETSSRTYISDPQVNAYFASVEELRSVFASSQELVDFFNDVNNRDLQEAYALLCMDENEKQVMGMELDGDLLRREVLQTTINFSGHKFVSPAASEADIRQSLKQCIFDGLVTHALQSIVSLKVQKNELRDQRRILNAKLRNRLSQGTGLTALLASVQAAQAELGDIEQQLAEAEEQLSNLPVNRNAPLGYLEEVKRILLHPEEFITLTITPLKLNRMSIKVSDGSSGAYSNICLAEIQVAQVLKHVIAIVRLPRSEMSSFNG